ncbi:hypothetical protein IF803_20040 [Bradyrhizobium sp. UFLA06-06]
MANISNQNPGAADQFSFSYFAWVMLIGLLFVFGSDLDRALNLWLLLVPLLLLPALAVAIYWTVGLIRNLWLRRWRRLASIAAAPIAVWIILAGAKAAGITSELMRFEIGKRYYVDQVEKLPRAGESRLATFDWGQTGGVGVSNAIYTLVFDESDEIALSPARRSGTWWDRVNRQCSGTTLCSLLQPAPEVSVSVRKVDGHFYLMTLAW